MDYQERLDAARAVRRSVVGAAPRAGVNDPEVDELLFQILAYCGTPRGRGSAPRCTGLAPRPPGGRVSTAPKRRAAAAQQPRGSAASIGFVGLGSMGSALAANLTARERHVAAYDAAGPTGVPNGVRRAGGGVTDVVREADTVVLSLPDGGACAEVVRELLAAPDRRTTHVVDTSTVGVAAARELAARLAGESVAYVDALVSGGVAGARARTLMVMYAGDEAACAHVDPVLAALSDHRTRVGDHPGQAQALKLANNFLSATALAATSEAVAFGTTAGLDMAVMLDVLDASSGRSAATGDKFPEHVLTGRYAAGFANSLMAKDVQLYLEAVADSGPDPALGAVTAAVWEAFAKSEPGADFTRIHPFVAGH